jgi:hypothetical protein
MASVPTMTSTDEVPKQRGPTKIPNQIQGSLPCYSPESCLIRKIHPCSFSQGKSSEMPVKWELLRFQGVSIGIFGVLPCILPCFRASEVGDWFDTHCVATNQCGDFRLPSVSAK